MTTTTVPAEEDHEVWYRSREELDALLADVRAAPRGVGTVEMLVRRPAENEREVMDEVHLTQAEGVEGDSWRSRALGPDGTGKVDADRQLNVMSARAVAAVAGSRERWQWAGDQVFLDLDLSHEALPAGTRLALGSAVIEVTEPPHRGCVKFRGRFGKPAFFWVNSEEGRELRLRGLNARVVTEGVVRAGDEVRVVGQRPA